MTLKYAIIVGSLVIILSICHVECKKAKLVSLESKETSTANFFRLLIMRLIFGIAVQMGWGESLASFMNGAFVPPGTDYDDYDDDFLPDIF
ncbi:uncharacterized protein LOC127280541 [Leptopilina boulardi]|uniref:uncharacterized protein LOC127280541 n=1 Tax=Leptopilina boulardi TaxID=63433 RepID=UPI0021F5A40A|nr:uncharacterized protein LOC127280541 [Leptopilina boulardi]